MDAHATDGACGYSDCQKYWIIFQALTVLGAAILATRLVGKIIISIRCVLRQDKALALALELTLVGIIAYIPGKIVYELIAGNDSLRSRAFHVWNKIKTPHRYLFTDYTCQFWSSDNVTCFLHNSTSFGNSLNVISAILVLLGLLVEILVFILIKDLPLYGDNVDNGPMVQLQQFTLNRDDTDGWFCILLDNFSTIFHCPLIVAEIPMHLQVMCGKESPYCSVPPPQLDRQESFNRYRARSVNLVLLPRR